MREALRRVLDNADTASGRTVGLFIQILIVASMVSYAAETVPGLSDGSLRFLRMVEVATVSVFTIEYIARVVSALHPSKFVFSFFGLVDLLAILPFYLATGLDLRWVRGLRLLRLVRALKLARYSRAVQRLHRALVIAREELVLFFFVTLVLLFFAAVGIYHFESRAQPELFSSVPTCLWWAVTSLTTVGYGDMYPVTVGGRVFTSIVLLLGLGVVAVPTGLFATALAAARQEESDDSPELGSN